VATKAVPIVVYESMICLSASTGSASQMPGNYFKVMSDVASPDKNSLCYTIHILACQRWRIVRSNKQGEISNEIYNSVGIAKTKQKNKVFGCGEYTMEVVLKVVALVELAALVKPLSVGRVVLSCGGTKVNDNRKMSSGNSSKSQHNTTQHSRERQEQYRQHNTT